MKTLEVGNAIIDVTDDVFARVSHGGRLLRIPLREQYERTFNNLAIYLEARGFPAPNSVRVLHGHGTPHGEYTLYEKHSSLMGIRKRPRYTPIATWIETHDGHYDALYVFPCNEANVTLNPGKSLIMYPKGEWAIGSFTSEFPEYLDRHVKILPPLGF